MVICIAALYQNSIIFFQSCWDIVATCRVGLVNFGLSIYSRSLIKVKYSHSFIIPILYQIFTLFFRRCTHFLSSFYFMLHSFHSGLLALETHPFSCDLTLTCNLRSSLHIHTFYLAMVSPLLTTHMFCPLLYSTKKISQYTWQYVYSLTVFNLLCAHQLSIIYIVISS